MKTFRTLGFLAAMLLGSMPTWAQFTAWNDAALPTDVEPVIAPARFRSVDVDVPALEAWLADVPSHGAVPERSTSILRFPTPDGLWRDYRVVEERVMAAELQARYPEIRTFVGAAADGLGGTVHFDVTERGFHAMLLTPGAETVFIDPVDRDGAMGVYLAYTRSAFFATTDKVRSGCEVREHGDMPLKGLRMGVDVREPGQRPVERSTAASALTPNGSQLRTYRLALACTGEYAQFHGGTLSGALSAMATSLVRINGVYHRDVAIHMELIANNDQIIYLNGSTDPYTNNNGGAMLSENQNTIDAVIGFSNYDIGHVFSTGGGGVAYLQSPCSSIKAGGVTGGGSPVGDPFDIDYVCHEMGHQFGANHTQNNPCNRASSAAFEPGSASTIMGYAGICAPNLQSNSDDHFHVHSINEMVAFSVNGSGNSCAVVTASNNTPPTLIVGPSGKTIPKSTPFELTAIASDPDAAAELTYNWEEYDLGPQTATGDNNLTNPSGTQPIMRSWPSESSPTRVFPRITDLVNGTSTIGELLPTYGREMNFRCTVRDNQTTGGVNDAEITFDVDGNSGPFSIISPSGFNNLEAGVPTSVIWSVAGTNAPPVSCSEVDLWLSTDGGFTWPYLLAGNEPNDGAATIVFPNVPTSSARIKVKASDNYFFDISDNNFTITAAANPAAVDAWLSHVSGATGDVCGEAIEPVATITNLGSEPLTAFDVTFSVDGGADEVTVNWTGSLAYLESVDVAACSESGCLTAAAGAHTLEVSVAVAGGTDENASNDVETTNFNTGCFEGCANCGCTDETACNFDSSVAFDDGSCTYPDPVVGCDCFLDASVNETLAGGASTTLNSFVSGDLESVDVTVEFTTNGSSWPSDLLLGICSPDGVCGEIGGYDTTLDYTVLGDWPVEWDVTTAGTYTATIDLSASGLTGTGNWTFEVVNGWATSANVAYDVAFTFNGICTANLVPGCTDPNACNYDATATVEDSSCTYAPNYFTCTGDCVNDSDGDGVCDELEVPGCTDPEACNYNQNATDNVGCELPESGFDCDGNPLSSCPEDLNENGLVEIGDMLLLLSDFGCEEPPCLADFNGDGTTTVADMLLLLGAFGTDCW